MNTDNAKCANNAKSQEMNPNLVVAIGASAGGFQEIVEIVEAMPIGFVGTLVIATHRTPGHKNMLADILAHKARVRVNEPENEEFLECTTIYVGSPNDIVEVDGQQFDIEDDRSVYARMHRIDDLFESVARSAGKNAIGIILSGMLYDGTAGLKAIYDAGGRCVIQSPADAEHPDMPINALAEVEPDLLGTTEEICYNILRVAAGRHCQ